MGSQERDWVFGEPGIYPWWSHIESNIKQCEFALSITCNMESGSQSVLVLTSHKINDGNDYADGYHRPAQGGGFDSPGEFATQRSTDQCTDRHDQCDRPKHLT